MANIRVGLSYYSVDTDRYLDIRIRRLVKAFGCDGIAVYDYLLCNIYRVKAVLLRGTKVLPSTWLNTSG